MAQIALNSPNSYMTGAMCLLKVNGKVVGFANGINFQVRIENRSLNTIDNIHPLEIYPYRTNISGQLHNFVVAGLSPTRMKIMPIIDNILISKYVTIEVYKKNTNGTLEKLVTFPKSMIVDRAETHPAGNVSRVTLTFVSTSWEDGDINTPSKQEPYSYKESKVRDVWNHLEPFENEQYVPDMAREYVSGSLKAFGQGEWADKYADRGIDYSVKAIEVGSYIAMDWKEDEAIMNSAKNQKK